MHKTGGVLIAWLAVPGVALAGDPLTYGPLQIQWRAPAECPVGKEIVQRIRALAPASRSDAEIVRVDATAARDEEGAFQVVLDTTQGSRRFQRRIQAPSCEAVADAAALTMALTIDPELASHAEAPPPSEPPPLPQPEWGPTPAHPLAATSGPSEAEPVTAAKTWSGPKLGLRLVGLADAGTLPRPGVGAAPSVELVQGRVHVGLGFLWMPERAGATEENPSKGGKIGLMAGTARACFTLVRGRTEVDGCAGAQLGQLHGEGYRVDRPAPVNRWWFAPELAALARFRTTGQLSAVAGVVGGFPFNRPEFVLENVGFVHQPARVVGRIEMGLEAHFP